MQVFCAFPGQKTRKCPAGAPPPLCLRRGGPGGGQGGGVLGLGAGRFADDGGAQPPGLEQRHQRLVGRAFERALERLCALPEEEQIDFLSRLAAAAALTGRERVALSPADRARWGGQVVLRANAALGERGCLTLSEDSRDVKGGLILEGEQVEVNCSFEALVREQREPLAAQVARLLFDAGD